MPHQNFHRTGQYRTYINHMIRVFVTTQFTNSSQSPFSPVTKTPNLSSPSHDSLYYQPKQRTINWKCLKVTTNLHCLIPPKMGHLMIPASSKTSTSEAPKICSNSSSPRSHAQIQRSIHPPFPPRKVFHGIHLVSGAFGMVVKIVGFS